MHLHTLLKFDGLLKDMMRSLLQASSEALQLKSGLHGNVYKFPDCVYIYMTNTWMSQTCVACREAQICIEGMSDDFLPP